MKKLHSLIQTLFLLLFTFQLVAQSYTLSIDSPESIAGEYDIILAGFGAQNCDINNFSGDLELVVDGTGGTEACDLVTNDLSNKIAVIDRGNCFFSYKCYEAEKQGAIAAIVCNNVDTDIFSMAPGDNADLITIPCFMLSREDCANIRIEFPFVTATIIKEGLEDEFEDDIVVWGNQPGEGDFDGGFNGWVALSNTCSGGTMGDDGALWEWNPNGLDDRGSFGAASIFSFTPCNGVAVFNSDFLDNEGDALDPNTGGANQAEMGDGQCVAPQDAELISQVIDLSNAGINGALALKFVQRLRQLNSQFLIGWSLDGGSTWSELEINDEVAGNASLGNIMRIVLPGVNQNSDLSNFRIRFRMLGDYYYWMIDDVQLIVLEGAEARINYAFYTPLSYAVPRDHTDADPFVFVAGVQNLGGQDLNDGELSVEIKNQDTKEIVFSKTLILPTIALGTSDTFDIVSIDEPYFPTDLDVGTYVYTYKVEFPGAGETDLTDNISESFFFAVTADYFAKENGDINNSLRVSSSQGWKIGSVYLTSPNFTDPIVLNKITTSVQSDSVRLNDNYFRIVVAKLIEDYAFGGDFDRDNPDPSNHPDFDPPVVDIFHAFTTEMSTDVFEIQVSDENNQVLLDPGSQYAIFAAFDENQAGGAALPNNLLRLGINSTFPDNGNYIIFDNDSPSWFTGFSGFDMNPHLRLTVNMDPSGVDNTPLPDHVFTLSPNPASNYVMAKIDFEEPINMNLMLADMTGKIISMKDYELVANMEERMDVSSLANGTYMMRVSTLEGTKTIKFVVQH